MGTRSRSQSINPLRRLNFSPPLPNMRLVLPLLYTLLVAPSASATSACSACSAPSTCVHNANHAEAATDADCTPCSPPTNQGWWPCNVDGLCLCKTAAPSTPPPPPPVACIYNTSHAQDATDADCKPCGPPTLQGWWPCNLVGLCDCSSGNVAAKAKADADAKTKAAADAKAKADTNAKAAADADAKVAVPCNATAPCDMRSLLPCCSSRGVCAAGSDANCLCDTCVDNRRLWSADGSCGNSESVGFRGNQPAQCDSESADPCCSP